MEFDMKKDSRRILVIVLASALMAFNIKSFVRTGGLYPGGATGLTLLIQRSFELFFQIEIPYTIVNVILIFASLARNLLFIPACALC